VASVAFLVGCSAKKDGEPVNEGHTKENPAKGVSVTVVGDSSGAIALRKAGCDVREGAIPKGDDIVFVAISCRQSVENKTLDSLDKAAGATPRQVAILLTEADASLDKDLLELVEMETRLVLSGVVGGDAVAEKLLVFRTNDRQLGEKIKALAEQKAAPITLRKPDRGSWREYQNRFKK
jgi:hypothetical protein